MEMMGKLEQQIELRFNGADYQPSRDNPRLTKQILRVWECMKDSQWRTLSEIAAITGDPEASVSAQLRHLRKERFGGHTVDRRYLKDGLYQYKLTPSLNPMLLTNGEKATKARAGND